MTDLAKSRPEFTAAIRGYDRVQVDEYVERLHSLLEEADGRARAAEDDLEFSRHATVGPRVSQIFDLAVAESQELRQRVQSEADVLRAEAREQAERIVAAAQADDEAMRERTEQQRQEMLEEMGRQHDTAREQLAALEERRAKLLGELKQLHEALGSAAGLIADQPVDSEVLGVTSAGADTAPTRLLPAVDGGAEDEIPPAERRRAGAAG